MARRSLRKAVLCAALLAVLCIVTAARGGEVTGPLVVSDNWPQCTDIKTWADDVLRIEGKTSATDREKALTLYYWTRLFVMSPKNGNEPYEGDYGNEQWQFDRHKVFFVWGGGDCGFQSAAHEAVWCYYNNDNTVARNIRYQAAGHVMCEVQYDSTWHAYDPLNGVFFLAEDTPTAHILSFAEIAPEDQLLRDNETYVNRCRPFFERVRSWDPPSERSDLLDITGFENSFADWQTAGSDPHVVYASYGYPVGGTWWDMNWRLPRGTRIERKWDTGDVFYVPQLYADRYSTQGRHYRQATDWGTDTTNWHAAEDIYNFPKCEPYLKLCTDPTEAYFYGYHTFFLAATGTMTYVADLAGGKYVDAVQGSPTLTWSASPPYLRPTGTGTTQEAVFHVRCPFILADGRIAADVLCGAGDTARFLVSVDGGSSWEEVASGGGALDVNIGQARYNGTDQSVTGKYEFLVKFECSASSDPATVGLTSLLIESVFDSSTNSLPRIVDGMNTIRFKVQNQSDVTEPIEVTYKWNEGATEETHTQLIQPGDFSGNEASYQFDATGLTRCVSYTMTYAPELVEGPPVVNVTACDLAGTVYDAVSTPGTVTVGGVDVAVSGGDWSRSDVPVTSGVPIVISATDASSNTATVNVTLTY